MKMLNVVFFGGFILLYFLNIALIKTANPFDPTWLIHSWGRFFLGFFILGVGSFYSKKITLKNALYLILLIDIVHYFYQHISPAYRLQTEIFLHGTYMITWGALVGYLAAKRLRTVIDQD